MTNNWLWSENNFKKLYDFILEYEDRINMVVFSFLQWKCCFFYSKFNQTAKRIIITFRVLSGGCKGNVVPLGFWNFEVIFYDLKRKKNPDD